MIADYQGLNIPEKITIVERPINTHCTYGQPREIPQGYVVPAGDKKALESAHNWADWTRWEWQEDLKRSIAKETNIGIEHTYDNGKFKMTIKEAAASSWSQSGKLSFWTCTIECPDGKQFDIGINAEYLCETMLHSTMIDGKIQENIWLGKGKGKTFGVTEKQPAYQQALMDAQKRSTKQTVKYEIGDIVSTLTSKQVYCGLYYKYFEIDIYRKSYRWGYDYDAEKYTNFSYKSMFVVVKMKNTPAPVHVFRDYYTYTRGGKEVYPGFSERLLCEKKPKRILTGETDLEVANSLMDEYDSYAYCRNAELLRLAYSKEGSKVFGDDEYDFIAKCIKEYHKELFEKAPNIADILFVTDDEQPKLIKKISGESL